MFKKGETAYLVSLPSNVVMTDRYELWDGELFVVTTGGQVFFEHELHPAHESVIEGKKDKSQAWYSQKAERGQSKGDYHNSALRGAQQAGIINVDLYRSKKTESPDKKPTMTAAEYVVTQANNWPALFGDEGESSWQKVADHIFV